MNFWRDISAFYFAWPGMLALLALVPLGWWLYARRLGQKLRQTALHFSYAAVVVQLQQAPALWKRLLMPMTVSLLSVCLIVGLARPTVTAKVPVNSVDMMLVMDISLSMLADDIRPLRMEAAKAAAIQFVASLPRDARIGLEVFAGDNYVLSPPTRRHEEVTAYLQALQKEDLKPRTEIGSALRTALKVLGVEMKPQAGGEASSQPPAPAKKPDRVIVLMSDGDSHEGYPWDRAARDAAQAGVVIHAIGIGSAQGGVITYQGLELPVNFDESTLRRIAELAGGSYFRVFKEADFRRVYEQIQARTIHYEQQEMDLAFVAAGLGLWVLLIGLGLWLFAW